MNLSNIEIILNQLAQNTITWDTGICWFKSLSQEERYEVLRRLYVISCDARVAESDIDTAIVRAGLRPTFTPCVLIKKGLIKNQLFKVINLPDNEQIKSFKLILALFAIADERRRKYCNGKCQHWWHQDLKHYKPILDVNTIENN